MTLIVDNEDVKAVLRPADVNQALEAVHVWLSEGSAINSPPYRVFTPRPLRAPDGFADESVMATHHSFTSLTGAVLPLGITTDRVDSDTITYVNTTTGIREVRLPDAKTGRFCGIIYVYDSETGALIACIHDGFLQKYRVAGTGAVAAKYLANPDSKTMALIGSGWQASAAAECFDAALDLDRILVFSPSKERRERFVDSCRGLISARIEAVDTAREAVSGADIVYTATNSPEPVVSDEWIQPGQFITGVKDLEAEYRTWARCDFLCVNRRGPMWQRHAIGGEDRIPEHGRDYWGRAGDIDWESLPLLGDVIRGQVPGRRERGDITGMFLRGDGVQFTAVASLILSQCRERGLGKEIPTDLFLQSSEYIP